MTPYYSDDLVTLYHGDCRDVLPTITSADLVIADPPYTFGLSSTQQGASKGGGWADLMNGAPFYAALLREFRRIVEGRVGAAWVFNSWRSFPILARASDEAQWPIESLLVWDKGPEVGMGGSNGLRSMYELVALLRTTEFGIKNRSTPDIWNVPWGGSQRRVNHPAEKPVALMARMVEVSGARGGLVVDPFTGSGSTLVAAKRLGTRAIGIEFEERHCERAAERLSQEVLGLVG